MVTSVDFIRRSVKIPRIGQTSRGKESPNVSVRKDNGLLSTLTQLLSLSTGSQYDDEVEPTAEDVEMEHVARDCITFCRLEDLFVDSRFGSIPFF